MSDRPPLPPRTLGTDVPDDELADLDDFTDFARRVADASGQTIIVGVRAMGRGWFAAAGAGGETMEIDSSGPYAAVQDLSRALRDRAQRAASGASRTSQEAERLRQALDGVAAPDPVEEG